MQNFFGDLSTPSLPHLSYSEKIGKCEFKIGGVHGKNPILGFGLRKINVTGKTLDKNYQTNWRFLD
jgi:hypothetical protein